MAPLITLPFHFLRVSSRPRLIHRYDTMQESTIFVMFEMHPGRLVSLPFLDFKLKPNEMDFAQVQAFFGNVQVPLYGIIRSQGELPNRSPSATLRLLN